ncbi:MAG: hypothetical protein ACRD5L_08450 [Bryobacteraceae bacterium]
MGRSFLVLVVVGVAQAQVSLSNGELRVEGRRASYELHMPMYEVAHVTNPETALLEQIHSLVGML